ncbi:MAG: bifunctional DNA-formamidopyrimidine glycosylase/DNA-(apurinic or apyrimidinic site) lyase [Burkholderiales bacterium]|nr:bifunctional DNA-formamidopyrimidine glycosylase/DNA-(apurinic or apyrimidinic site) lyase [Burkholderiales bacterium]
MPELPEVETTRLGLAPHVIGRRIEKVVVRDRRLRWPIAADLEQRLAACTIRAISRRGKYLLLDCGAGWLMLHLGMSGSLQIVPAARPAAKHDHVDIILNNGTAVRFTDPRRFGAIFWAAGDPQSHPLLAGLGLEPLTEQLSGPWLYSGTRGAKVSIKLWLMDATRITGIGNIYANEALFRAGIHPLRAAGRIALKRFERLASAIQDTLCRAIDAGGSTLRDFVGVDGKPGYFQQEYWVYGRADKPCLICAMPIRLVRQSGRATYYCPTCQR